MKNRIVLLCVASLMSAVLSGCGGGGFASGSMEAASNGSASVPENPLPPQNPTYEVYPGCEPPATNYLRTVYVDPVNGTDAGDGSVGAPLKTVANAFSSKKILPGDRVIAKPGNHGAVNVTQYTNPTLQTATSWIWIDAQEGAIFKSFNVGAMTRWLITNVEVSNSTGTLLSLGGGSQFVVADGYFYSSKNTSGWTASDWMSTPNAISTRNTRCASILRNKITNVRFGITNSTDYIPVEESRMNLLVADNEIRNYSGDGMRPIASNVHYKNNAIIDIYVNSADGDGNHDDAIQGFALNGAVYDNVVIEGTYILESTNPNRRFNASVQGISVFDGLYTNLVVRKNIVLVSAYHGISMYGPKDCIIEDNTVLGTLPGRKTWISVPQSKGAVKPVNTVVRNNIANVFTIDASGTTQTNNYAITDAAANFVKFDLATMTFDLHLLPTSTAYGKNAGYY